MKAILSTVVASLVLTVSGLKMADFQKLSFAGGSCDSCQATANGVGCCDEGSKPTVGQGCQGSSGSSESDCDGAAGKHCGDSGIEQSKACKDTVTEDCKKGYSYTCEAGEDGNGNPTPPRWVKGAQNVDCGKKQLCSME